MTRSLGDELRTQGRGVTGALLVVGLSTLFTMETWWLSWRLPVGHLVVAAAVGLAFVFLIVRSVGFRQEGEGDEGSPVRLVTDFAELLLQSFVAAFVILLAFGVVRVSDPLQTVVRMGLVQVVPLGFGAAVANALLAESDQHRERQRFPENLGVFTLGAAFFAVPMAPTEEVVVIARNAGWVRIAGLVVLSVAVVHLVLHELEFRGQDHRVEGRSAGYLVGTSVTVYAVGVLVSVALLLGFGQFNGRPLQEWVQLAVVLSFPAAAGASAGEVVL